MYYKKIPGTDQFDVIVNETKLSSNSPFTENQTTFMNQVEGGTTNLTLRTSKLEGAGVPKGATLNVQAFVKTIGDGTTGGTYTVTKI